MLGTKEKILKSAEEIILQNGYNATGTNAIVKHAGVSKGSFFHFFATKEILLLELLDLYFEENLKKPLIESCNQNKKQPYQTLISFIEEIENWYMKSQFYGGCLIGNIALELSDISNEVRKKIASYFDQWKDILYEILSDTELMLDQEDFINLYIASIEGVTMTVKAHKDKKIAKKEFLSCKRLVEIAFNNKN